MFHVGEGVLFSGRFRGYTFFKLNLGVIPGDTQRNVTLYKSSDIQSAITPSKIIIFQRLKYQKNRTDSAVLLEFQPLENIDF